MAFLWLAYFLWKTYKMASDDFQSFEQNYSDLAVAESLVDRLCNENKAFRAEINEMQGQITRLQRARSELEAHDEMLSDQADGLHYGIVMLGGYTICSELRPAQRQHMFTLERANLVAARTMALWHTMGSNRYIPTQRNPNWRRHRHA